MTFGCDAPPDALPIDRAVPRLPGRVRHVGPGVVTDRCPRAWSHDPVAVSAWPEYLWWDKGQLGPRGELPERLVRALDLLHLAYSSAAHLYRERQRAKRDNPGGSPRPRRR